MAEAETAESLQVGVVWRVLIRCQSKAGRSGVLSGLVYALNLPLAIVPSNINGIMAQESRVHVVFSESDIMVGTLASLWYKKVRAISQD